MQGYSIDPEHGETKIKGDVSNSHVFNILSILVTVRGALRKHFTSIFCHILRTSSIYYNFKSIHF